MRICFSLFFQDTFYTRDTHFGTCMEERIKPSCQAKSGIHVWNNTPNVPLTLNENHTLKYVFSYFEDISVLALKIS